MIVAKSIDFRFLAALTDVVDPVFGLLESGKANK